MESRHLIIDYRYAHGIGATTNISMSHVMFLIFLMRVPKNPLVNL
ncbi:putative membrane protein [Helicobacter pylori Hp A-20]|nr:putative membrane protein [Helicobacter pylori Hp A-20]